MKVYKEITRLDEFKPWSGAVETYNNIIKAGKSEEFIAKLESFFDCEEVSYTDINNLLWFESEACYDLVGLDKDGNEKSEKEEEEDEDED